MAEDTVCFSGSSAEEIELAKRFWQSIYPPVKPKSALVVNNIEQRLRTAQKPQNALEQFKLDAEKRKSKEDREYRERICDFRKESQNLIQKRRKERIMKEEISSRVIHQQEHFMEFTDSEGEEEDGRQAMDDIEKFESKLRQQEKLKPS